MKVVLPLIKSIVAKLLISVLTPLGLQVAESATDAAIQKRIYGSGMTTLITSNKETEDIMKKVKYLKRSGLLIKGVRQKIKNEAIKQKVNFLACY